MRLSLAAAVLLLLPTLAPAQPGKGNRLAYLDEVDPDYPSHTFPKLTTPMWVGDKDVDAVVILGIDDMKDPKQYEKFLRPILNRLKKIDGRAPVSIMTCSVDPKDEQLQAWLKEGLSLECHTVDHPCPFFKGGFKKAEETYDKCVDLMHAIPNNKPVAFRMPCCDSMNTPSPRFYAEIFNKTTDKGHFLQIDTSVFNVFTSKDPELPKELVLDDEGKERFQAYLPADRSFVNTIENYPYPYVIGRLCWEFPCMTPSDWQAQHRHKPNNPQTIADWKAALDCTVIKQGVFSLLFHPHGWIKSEQVVDFIDYAVKKHGKKVKFLTFREALERLNRNLLIDQPLRVENEATASAVRILDVNNDQHIDIIIGTPKIKKTRLWNAKAKGWLDGDFPSQLVSEFRKTKIADWKYSDSGQRFGIFRPDGNVSYLKKVSVLFKDGGNLTLWDYGHFTRKGWNGNVDLIEGLGILAKFDEDWICRDQGYRLRDLNGDGSCELVSSKANIRAVYEWHEQKKTWKKLPFEIPPGGMIADSAGLDGGLRFLDLDGDGKLDVIFSNEKEYGIYLFENMEKGWSKKVMAGKREDKDALPMISRGGTNNGFWVHSGHLWWSNEDTVLLKDHVDRRAIKELLKSVR